MTEHDRSASPQTSSIQQLRTTLNGRVITPGDASFDEARTIFYGGFDRHPAAIVRARDASDVSQVVSLRERTGSSLPSRAEATASPVTAPQMVASCSTSLR